MTETFYRALGMAVALASPSPAGVSELAEMASGYAAIIKDFANPGPVPLDGLTRSFGQPHLPEPDTAEQSLRS